MKSEILEILRAQKSIVSGELLSERLKTSRVSIWKHIRRLQECGYGIESSAKGYLLVSSPDIPFPWEFPLYENRMAYFPEVDSTMDEARGLARKGALHMSLVVAGSQKKGRGRLRRKWLSDPGGLYFTVILKPKLAPALSFKINFAASLALAKTFREYYSIEAMVKWPNDILVEDKKLSGTLSEMETEADLVKYVNLGIGINVDNFPRGEDFEAVSMKEILKRKVSRIEVLSKFLDQFENTTANIETEDVVRQWKEYTGTLHRNVRIVTSEGETEGVARDVDETGALLVELPGGKIKRVLYGDCFYKI